ncbi:hypothetical protein STENM223S_05022 [Streptomyces tendae]
MGDAGVSEAPSGGEAAAGDRGRAAAAAGARDSAAGSAASAPKQEGKALRARVPRSAHAALDLDAGRPDAVTAVEESGRGRLPELTPLRVGRMAATPFAFLRGSAGLMAYDLARTPVTGIGAQICGDAHAANFGLYGDARGALVIDLNDFDETVHGPWEWDLEGSPRPLVLAGREAGADEDVCSAAADDAVGAYRRTMRLLAKLPALDAWNAIAARNSSPTPTRTTSSALWSGSPRRPAPTPAAASPPGPPSAPRTADAASSTPPPVLRRVPDAEAAAVASSLEQYLATLPADRHPLLARYAVHDVAFRVVGTGSVGTRSYVVLLLDHRGRAAGPPGEGGPTLALLPHLPAADFDTPEAEHEGRRVVEGQKRMQVISDSLLGWTSVDGRPYQVRQFRNRKGSVDPAALAADQVDDYARMTGALLARAHSHSADPRLIAGYCGKNDELDEAVAAFAVAYADRTEADHTDLVAAVRAGRIAAEAGV